MDIINIPEGYKQTEMGVIPKDWDFKQIGEIAVVSSGGTPSRSNPSYWNGNIPWITTTQIDFNTIISSNEFITELGLKNSAAKLYTKNTLLMAMYGQGKTRGKVAILGIEATINQACAAIIINKDIYNNYVFFYLAHNYEEIRKLSNTGNQENLNGNIIKSIFVSIPPLPEQKAIAQSLSDVDALITECDRTITKKRNAKQGTMQQLLTGKKRLPGFSGEWEVKILEEVSKLSSGTTPSRKLEDRYYSNGNINWVKTTDLNNAEINDTEEKITELALNETCLRKYDIGTVLVAMYGGFNQIGRTGLLKIVATVNQALIAIQPQTKILDSIFLINYLNFQVDYWKNIAISSRKDPNITSRDVKKFPIPVPCLLEQKAIAQILSDMDAEIAALEQKRDKYKAIKQGMMQELLTGKTRLIGSY
ncbi:restriction endonuclease subunit S [Nostoc sp.]|uniref:restriction endonuclease subunit S n=1 Tax=Nostoc sp. TaxID=1180 RepID=UPI002FF88C93